MLDGRITQSVLLRLLVRLGRIYAHLYNARFTIELMQVIIVALVAITILRCSFVLAFLSCLSENKNQRLPSMP